MDLLDDVFCSSYRAFERYPENLVCQGPLALEGYKNRFDKFAQHTFIDDNTEAHVPFRDWQTNTQAFERETVSKDEGLKRRLGDQSIIDTLTSTSLGALATKRDPQCRFIFISAGLDGHSRQQLKISRRMFSRILSYHQVMPEYLDFMSLFGLSSKPRDLRFSSFREQTLLRSSLDQAAIPKLGRSGQQFQLCYNLKAPFCSSPATSTLKEREWSIRQAAVHHQFDVKEGTALWIITKGNLEIKELVQKVTGKTGRPSDRAFGTPQECFISSLAIHLLLCHWSLDEWRWYIQWLEEVIDKETTIAVTAPRDKSHARHKYSTRDLQDIQFYEGKTNEAAMILEANIEVLAALRKHYKGLLNNTGFPLRTSCRQNINGFANQLDNRVHDLTMQISRAKLLTRITADTKSMILQHLQTQGTERMEDLTQNMHQIGVLAQEEAIAVRIITVVTLIYLPATFVSTFFSTDVVKYQNQNSGDDGSQDAQTATGNFSPIALRRWLQLALPLTAITLSLGYLWYKIAKRKRRNLLPSYFDTKFL